MAVNRKAAVHDATKTRNYKPLLKGKAVQRILLGTIGILVLSIFIPIKFVLFLACAIVFNAWLTTFQLDKGLPTDFELSTFSTVLMTLAFGFKEGVITAIATKAIASVYSGSIVADHLFMIATYCWAAVMASFLGGLPFTVMGMTIIIVNNILMFMISRNILGLDLTSNLSYTLTNFVFNMVVFTAFGEFILALVR